MPLHDWSKLKGWSGVHIFWMTDLARDLRAKLPTGYRAYIGNSPIVAADDPPGVPDVAVRTPEAGKWWLDGGEPDPFQPDREVAVNLAVLEADKSIYVEQDGRLVAAIELVSLGNKDDLAERSKRIARYLGYLTNGVHLLLVDVHPRPKAFSFADELASALSIPDEPSLAVPHVVSYRVRPDKPGGFSTMHLKRQRLEVGQPLPSMPLALYFPQTVWLDLEGTYTKAAADAYLT